MDKNTFYTMAHTNDPTIVTPDANEDAFNRPVDVDPSAENNAYSNIYYGYGYVENMKFKPSENSGGGGGGGVTQEQMTQAINNALNSITLTRSTTDDNGVVLNVGGRTDEITIDDKFLTGITNTQDGNVVFSMNNGDTITTSLTDLDERNFDCETF